MKHSGLILLSSKLFVHIGREYRFSLWWLRWGELHTNVIWSITQSIQCFWGVYILNTVLATLHDIAVMLLLSICEHLSVHWMMEKCLYIITDACLRKGSVTRISLQNDSLQSNAMGEAILHHAAPERVNTRDQKCGC